MDYIDTMQKSSNVFVYLQKILNIKLQNKVPNIEVLEQTQMSIFIAVKQWQLPGGGMSSDNHLPKHIFYGELVASA